MAMMEISVWKWINLVLFFCFVDGAMLALEAPRPREPVVTADEQISGPLFMVTFPSLIESGSGAKLCASLLKPQGSLTITITLVDDKNTETQLVRQTTQRKLHRCFNFQAPLISGDSVQTVRVVVQGQSFKMTEERKVMFRSYLPLTFIQTDKPLYNPGQTVNFRVVTMSDKLVPLDQMYNLVVLEDFRNIRINQWTNVSSVNWILELSHVLIPEAQVGTYTLRAYIGDRIISQSFDVKQYVLPKFDVTVNAPQTYSVADVGLKVEACGKYTFGQPVPGQVLVQVCRQPLTYVQDPKVTSICLNKSTKTNNTGCAALTLSTSSFFGTSFESNLQNWFIVNVNLTEEGTGVVMSKSTTVSITFEVGKVTFVDLPKFYNYGSTVNGKISVSDFNGNPIYSKAVYAAQAFTPGGSSTVTVQSSVPAGDIFNFAVTPNNRLLYQRNSLNNFPGTYSVVARGSACASVQVACFYNIPTPLTVARTLSVVAKVTGDCQAAPVNLMLTFTVKYNGRKPTTNMVLVDIKVLSGFTADTSLLGSPPNFAPLVQRVDSNGDHVLVYLQEVPKGVPVTFSIQLTQAVAVQNLKPAVINIYDYYQRNDKFETTYKSPCP
nr:Si:dkey-46g23.3 protein [Danio rerio]